MKPMTGDQFHEMRLLAGQLVFVIWLLLIIFFGGYVKLPVYANIPETI